METELLLILESLSSPKTLLSASPKHIVRYLIWKVSKGRTQVHKDGCQYLGQQGKHPCNCPYRLSAGTVDSTIGKLRSIFNHEGRSGDWNDNSVEGNPAAHHSVKSYLKSVQLQLEQAHTRVSPK